MMVKVSVLMPHWHRHYDEHLCRDLDMYDRCIKIEQKNSDFLLLKKDESKFCVPEIFRRYTEK